MISRKATLKDLPELLQLQNMAIAKEAGLNKDSGIINICQSASELQEEFLHHGKIFLVVEDDDEMIAAVRAVKRDNTCLIQQLVVHPEYQDNGIGKELMKEVECLFPESEAFEISTGINIQRHIKFYENLGYQITKKEKFLDSYYQVYMVKQNHSKIMK